jgi:hypothetical protein
LPARRDEYGGIVPSEVKRALLLAGIGLIALAAVATAAAKPVLKVTIVSATHHPKVNVGWPVKIVATADGKPVAGTLTMAVLFNGARVGQIDNGKVYHFVGSWQERPTNLITWPATSKGFPLTFEVIVKADGVTADKTWAIDVG